jgi:transposase InsO family protein
MRVEFLEGRSLTQLARSYHVSTKTVQKWVHREETADRSSAPHRRRSKRGGGLKSAVKQQKEAHPHRGCRRIAHELRKYYPGLTRSRVMHILKVSRALGNKPHKKKHRPKPIPVGRHRVQMDIQQLPAVRGGRGFEYKISVIHLATRIKYSEIHPTHSSKLCADVLVRALDHLPPVRLVWTDNAFDFHLRFSYHPERTTAFQKCLMALDILHGTCKPRSPWQNGIIERSHRTDNEELFEVMHFSDPEERRLQLRLWEMYYASERPHQGLGGLTPLQVYQRDYPIHSAARMLA